MSVAAPTPPSAAARAPRRRSRTVLWIAVVVGLVIAGFVGVLATRRTALNIVAPSPLEGKPAPEITGTTLDGRTIRLSELRNQYVVVNFLASWCIPCQNEHPELQQFIDRHQATGDATVLSVIFSDEVDNVRRFFAERGGDWPTVDDPKGQVALDYGVRGPPESFVVDRDGFVLTRIVGEVDADGLDRLLREARRVGR